MFHQLTQPAVSAKYFKKRGVVKTMSVCLTETAGRHTLTPGMGRLLTMFYCLWLVRGSARPWDSLRISGTQERPLACRQTHPCIQKKRQ